MPTKRQKRSEKKLKNIKKQRQKYPAIVEKIIETSDIILEVLDARFHSETRNYELEEEIKRRNKKLIYVLNKSDLTKTKIPNSILISCKNRTGIKKLRNKIKSLSKKLDSKKISVGVIGYPNTGKSSLINLLIGKSSAKTGSEAGFTKGLQKLKLTENITLFDTPGIIPKKEYSNIKKEKIARHTIVGSRSYSQVKDPEIIINELMKKYPKVLEKHYKILADNNSETLLEKLGKKLNYFKKGRQINFDKTARKILKDWQEGLIRFNHNNP